MGWRRPTPERTERSEAPTWAGEPVRTRILVEHPDPTVRDVLQRDLVAEGYEVLACGGPRPEDDRAASCPLLRQQPCPAVTGADVVVSGLSLTDHVSRIVLRRITRNSRPPLILAARAHDIDAHADGITPHHLFPVDAREVSRLVDDLV